MSLTSSTIRRLYRWNPYIPLGLGALYLIGIIVFLYFQIQITCESSRCVGLELYSPAVRFFLYFALSAFITLSVVLVRVFIKYPNILLKAFGGVLEKRREPTQKDNSFFWLTWFFAAMLISFYAVPMEFNIANNFTYCYDTSGEYRKDGHYFDHTSRNLITSALYVSNSIECPNRYLFMYWYDEKGREFESFDTHPKELELELEALN